MRGWENINSLEKLKARGMVQDFTYQPKNRSIVVEENTLLLKKVKRKMKHEESDLQIKCVETFRMVYPKLRYRLFSIPNGGFRNAITAAIMNAEGSLPGVSDLFLSIPDFKNKRGGMYIEMKTDTGRLSEYQIAFIKEMQADYKCVVVRSVEGFLREVKEYLKG